MARRARPYLAFAAALIIGAGTAAAYIHFGPRALIALVGLLVWPGYALVPRFTHIQLAGGAGIELAGHFEEAIKGISEAPPDQIQQVAAAEIRLLSDYYRTALAQARQSFNWALIGVAVGPVFFAGAVVV